MFLIGAMSFADSLGETSNSSRRFWICLETTESRLESIEGRVLADEAPYLEDVGSTAPGTLLKKGQRVGPYIVDARLGSGGMATVYRVRDERHDRFVAMKVARSARHQAVSERESRFLGGLAHPYVARLIDSGELEDGSLYVVMEYVDGVNLIQFAQRHSLSFTERVEALPATRGGGGVSPRSGCCPSRSQTEQCTRGQKRPPTTARFWHCSLLRQQRRRNGDGLE